MPWARRPNVSVKQPALLAHQFDNIEQQREAATPGRWTFLATLLGTLFMVFKSIEYYTDYRDNLVPGTTHFDDREWLELDADPKTVSLFFLIYYIMTGVHAVHLTIGIGVLVWLIVLAGRG